MLVEQSYLYQKIPINKKIHPIVHPLQFVSTGNRTGTPPPLHGKMLSLTPSLGKCRQKHFWSFT
jgi:hypothetical protein